MSESYKISRQILLAWLEIASVLTAWLDDVALADRTTDVAFAAVAAILPFAVYDA
jgi:hypothetical protein